jgi:hypothetical protein
MLTTDIKAQIKAANDTAVKLGGTTQGRERVTVRIDATYHTAVFLYPDDDANLGKIAASFWDCGHLHYGEVSYDWYHTQTKSPLTTTIGITARANFARSLAESITRVDQNYRDGHNATYSRFVPRLSLKLPSRLTLTVATL